MEAAWRQIYSSLHTYVKNMDEIRAGSMDYGYGLFHIIIY